MTYIIRHGVTGSIIGRNFQNPDAAEQAAMKRQQNYSMDIMSRDDDGRETLVSFVSSGTVYPAEVV